MTNTRLDGVLHRQKRNRLLDIAFAAMVAVGVSLGAAGFAEHARTAAPANEAAATDTNVSAARAALDELAARERMGG